MLHLFEKEMINNAILIKYYLLCLCNVNHDLYHHACNEILSDASISMHQCIINMLQLCHFSIDKNILINSNKSSELPLFFTAADPCVLGHTM